MKKLLQVLCLMMVTFTTTPSFGQSKAPYTTTVATLKAEMRKLWEDHSVWTRNMILCLVDDLPGTDQAVKRVLQNQVEIGNAFKPFYGEEAGDKLTELLKKHIDITAEVVRVSKEGSTVPIDEATKRWYANADKISEFFNKQNSYLPLADMITMMNTHLKLMNDQAQMRIKKDYAGDVVAYDKLHDEMLLMSDMIVDGIVKQFPKRFKANHK
jgi:hypothetical protein